MTLSHWANHLIKMKALANKCLVAFILTVEKALSVGQFDLMLKPGVSAFYQQCKFGEHGFVFLLCY